LRSAHEGGMKDKAHVFSDCFSDDYDCIPHKKIIVATAATQQMFPIKTLTFR
jgi:hypothetical protein